MLLTLVSTSFSGWHIKEVQKACEKLGVDCKVINIQSINNIEEILQNLGDVILWRAASISPSIDRTILLNIIKDKIIIDHAIIQPLLSYKLYQQKIIKHKTTVPCIPTYKFKNKSELKEAIKLDLIKYPFIQKPNLGCRGNNVSLIKNKKDLEKYTKNIVIKDFVYQNFIPNEGDYRVLMLGGKVLGVMKRKAQEGNFLNNISKGGTASKLIDEELYEKITDIAKVVSGTLDLTFCGVDVIQNTENNEFYFLEVNTAPQWRGFQSIFNEINVAEELIKHAIELYKRKNVSAHILIKDYYDNNYKYLESKRFHYASRMYLWTKEYKYKQWLIEYKPKYLGKNLQEIENKIKEKVLNLSNKLNSELKPTKTQSKKIRSTFFERYPKLRTYNKLLFLNLFAYTIYNIDIKPIISKYVTNEEFLDLYSTLSKDKEAIFTLSTHAINYFYLLQNYLGNTNKIINVQDLFEIAQNYTLEDKLTELKFRIYLLTHCIIGASKFYYQKVQDDIYTEMCKYLESIISKNYFDISLDNKCEFIVCCKLTDYSTYLEPIIKDEADNSLSNIGNFIIDKYNKRAKIQKNQYQLSEHRNVLFLMSYLDKNWD